ncbi:unnamed protein product [Effrenium voratum]|uniref:Uncharacterized protein n=1 Tax=Effrenium voratum TaxID=2562239 RepID=A0AA36JC74_9DINO|nr:unnamed protein product [Effrenium voratum]
MAASQLLSQRRALARRGLQEGDLVVVVASRIPEPYNLEQEQSGRLVKVDEEGDAYVSFFEDEDLWVHKSVLHLLAKAPESLPLARQVSQLGAATLWALCGLEAVLRLPAAVESTATLAIFLLLPLADLGQVRSKLFRFPELCASAGPALLMLSALWAQEVLLAFSVLAFAWSAAEELSFSETFACRQRDGWALLCAMVLRMVLCMTSDLALASPLARITLGACGAAAAVWLSFTLPLEAALRQHRAASPVFQAAPWAPPQVVMMGLLTGSVLILFQLFLYSAEAPAQLCLRDPGVIMSLPTWLSLGLGVAACFASWDSQTEQIVLAVLPPCAVGLPLLRPGVAGAGFPAFCGLQLLALAFPKMLVVLGRHLARVSAKPWAGRCACTLFVAACAWGSTLILQALRASGFHGCGRLRFPLKV